MHETGVMNTLVKEIEKILAEQDPGSRVVRVRIAVGDMMGSTPEHMRDHFGWAAAGTPVEGAEVEIVSQPGMDVVLESVEIES